MTTFFCDTSIVYHKLLGDRIKRQLVDDAVVGGDRCITNFVRCEFLRGYVESLIELKFAIEELGDVEAAIETFLLHNAHKPRRVINALKCVTSWFVKNFEDSADAARTARRIGDHLRTIVIELDDVFKHRITDPLRCQIGVLEFPPHDYDPNDFVELYWELKEIVDKPACQQCQFRANAVKNLMDNGIDLYSDARQEEFKESKGYVAQAKNAEAAVSTKRPTPSCDYCTKLGDTIITLSAPADAKILTADRASFPVLGKLLNRDVVLLVEDRPKLKDIIARTKPEEAPKSPPRRGKPNQ